MKSLILNYVKLLVVNNIYNSGLKTLAAKSSLALSGFFFINNKKMLL